jgi:hypothetical protein
MRPSAPTMAVLAVVSLPGCTSLLSDTVGSAPGSDATFVISGKYTESSQTARSLDDLMTAEADKRCPAGWTKVSDEPNGRSFTGGRVWRVRCNSGGAAASAPANAAPTPPAAGAGASEARTGIAAPPSMPPSAGTAAVAAAGPPGAVSQDDLVRMLAAAVKRASPYLTDAAAEAIVAEELRTLEGAKLGILPRDSVSR